MEFIFILLVLELSKPLPVVNDLESVKAESSVIKTNEYTEKDRAEMKAAINKAAREAAEKTNARFKDWEDNFIEETKKEVENFKIKKYGGGYHPLN